MSTKLLRGFPVGVIPRGALILGSPVVTADIPWYLSGSISPANCIAAYQAKGASSLANSYIDLTGNGNNAAPGVAPTWNTTDGWIFTSGKWLTTGYTPTSQAAVSAIILFSNLGSGENPIVGCTAYTNGRLLLNRSSAGNWVIANGTGTLTVSSEGATGGVLAVAGQRGYYNGNDIGSVGAGYSAAPTFAATIANYASVYFGSVRCQAFAIYNATITAQQVAAVTAAMNLL